MKAKFVELGNIEVNAERIWCSDVKLKGKPIELYALNGSWNVNICRSGSRNIAVVLSHETFPYNVKHVVSEFFIGNEPIADSTRNWGVIRDRLPVDCGEAFFCSMGPIMDNYENTDYSVFWGKNGLRLETGFGDGNYNIYTFVETKGEKIFPMLIIADFMIFAGGVEIE